MLSARQTTPLIRCDVAGSGKQTLSGVRNCSDAAGFCSRGLSVSRLRSSLSWLERWRMKSCARAGR